MSKKPTVPLVDDIFHVTAVDREKKVFKSVSRIEATSETYSLSLRLDYNCDIYDLPLHQTFSLAITPVEDESLIPSYDYVMSGKIYKEDYKPPNKLVLQASFGGLLMEITGEASTLEKISLDDEIFLLIKKTGA